MTSPKLVLSALEDWARLQPLQKVWTFLDDKGEIADSFTYRELDRAASSLAVYLLQSCKLKAGERALLVFFPGLHFTASLLACFKAGIIAIPVFPPDPRRLQKDLTHFISIQNSSGATVALTHNMYNFAKKVSDIQGLFSSKGKTWPDLKWIVVDDVLSRGKAKGNEASSSSPTLPLAPKAQDIAFLQYTSGSTSEPKGVMITHGNLAHNLTLIIKELKATQTTVNVSWLPQYHDMGLIGSYLGTLYCGGVGFFLSPISFLKDPNVWLRSMSRFQGTHTQAPNFAYALASRKFRDAVSSGSFGIPLPQFRLHMIQHMINAAEPVDQVAIANFYETFRPYGLRSGVVVPTYGLAEHTVFVCSGGQHVLNLRKSAFESQSVEVQGKSLLGDNSSSSSGVDTQTIVGCGYPERGDSVMLCIVDTETQQRLPDRKIGEIWVSSPSKAMGYWNLPDLSAQDFNAMIPDVPSVAFLRTGDLGFLHEGELFICGRSKDLIIVRGSNHYPQDIERTAERACSSLLRPGCSAAFSLKHEKGHTETVVYVAEVVENAQTDQNKLAEIIRTCRAVVAAEHGLMLSSVVLLRTRTVPKTTSGKIARAWCRKAYVDGTLSALTRWDGGEADVEDTPDTGVDGTVYLDMQGGTTNGDYKSIPGDVNLFNKNNGPGDAITQEPSAVGAPGQGPGGPGLPKGLSVEEVRALSETEIIRRLETTLKQIASQGPAPIQGSISPQASLLSLGLDSFTIVQFKGVIEKRYYCDIPDEFLFIQTVNLTEIARAVRNGGLTVEQRKLVDSAGQPGAGSGRPSGGPTAVVVNQKQPMCPWFTCCY